MDIPADWQATLSWGRSTAIGPGEWSKRVYNLRDLTAALTKHKAGSKDGECFLQGVATGGNRNSKAMDPLYIIGIDVDNGMPSEEIDKIIRRKGVFCIRYTTHSHLKSHTDVKKDEWVKFKRKNEGATIGDYLIDKKRYLPEIAEQAEILKEEMTAKSGMLLRVKHPAMDKNRLVFILAKPWTVSDYEMQSEALASWKSAYLNFGAWLGIEVDPACTDTARLFYYPRHDEDAPYEVVVHEGPAIDIFALPKVQVVKAGTNRFTEAAAEMGASDEGGSSPEYRRWAVKNANRFLIYDVLEEFASDKLRPEFDRGSEKRHIECPFEGSHTEFGGGATYCTNAGESETGGFVINCLRGGCRDRDRLTLLAEMVNQEWFPRETLDDPDYLLEVEDDEDGNQVSVEPTPLSTEKVERGEIKTLEDAERFMQRLAYAEVPQLVVTNEIDLLSADIRNLTGFAMSASRLMAVYNKYVKQHDDKQKAAVKALADEEKAQARIRTEEGKEKAAKEDPRVTVHDTEDFMVKIDKTIAALVKKNGSDPRMFMKGDEILRVRVDSYGYPRAEHLDSKGLRHELSRAIRYMATGGIVEREDYPETALVDDILANRSCPLPVLLGVSTAPVFSKEGKIETKRGYQPASQMYFHPTPEGLTVPAVSKTPTEDEVEDALDLLLGNALVDFPFDGKLNGDSERAHALCLILQPFVRQMIQGATPIFLIVKPTPGTGASKLVNIYSLIAHGESASAQTETRAEDEIRKRVTAVVMSGAHTFYLDNINYRIDSSALASATTTDMWIDRVLGSSKVFSAPIHHTWIFAGNNPSMSNEMARRCVRIRLDAKTERPELRTDFKHVDLENWVKDNRGELIWACLTLVQNWIAKGKPSGTATKGSYESWAKVLGGILLAADVPGFLENDKEMREDSDEDGAAMRQMIEIWWNDCQSGLITVGGDKGLYEVLEDNSADILSSSQVTGTSNGGDHAKRIAFGKFINSIKDRIFTINAEDGNEFTVKVSRSDKKLHNKVCWLLQPVTKTGKN